MKKSVYITLLALAALALGALATVGMTIEWELVVLGAIAVVVPFVVGAARQRIDVFEPIYLFSICYGILFVVRPVFDLLASDGVPAWVGYPIASGYGLALLVGLVGAVGFYVGYAVPLGDRVARGLPLPSGFWSRSSLAVFVLSSVILCLALSFVFLALNGGLGSLGAFLSGRSAVSRQVLSDSSGYLYTAPLWLGSIGLLILAISRRWRSAVGALAFCLILFSQIESLAFGDRSWLLPMALSVALLAYLRRGRRPGAMTIVIAAAIVFIFGITVPRQFRETDARTQPLAQTVATALANPGQSALELFQGLDTAMVDGLAAEVEYVPSGLPYQMGGTYLGDLTRPVPRAVWASKPTESEVLLMQNLLPSFAARHIVLYFSAFGEPYLDFGLVGVVLFALVFGVAWRAIYRWFQRDPRNPNVYAIYAASWPFLFVYMRGGVGTDYQRQLITILPMICAMLFALIRVKAKHLLPLRVEATVS